MRNSPTDHPAHFGENLLSWKGLHLTGSHFVATADSLGCPEFLNLATLGKVQALNELFREFSSGRGREMHRLFGKLVEREWHGAD